MNWFKSRRLVGIVSISLVSLFLITEFVLAGYGTTISGAESIDAKQRGLVEVGKITQDQADMKHKVAAGGKLKKGKWQGKIAGEGIDAKRRELVKTGKITQEQADMKRKAVGRGKAARKR